MADEGVTKKDKQGLDDLIRKIPGVKGYLAKEDRRDSDKQLRDRLVALLVEAQTQFALVQKELIADTGFAYMEKTQSIDRKLQNFIDRVRTAARGYASLFDRDTIDEAALDRLYVFDNALFGYLDQISGQIDALKDLSDRELIGENLRELESVVTDANDTFKKRDEVITSEE